MSASFPCDTDYVPAMPVADVAIRAQREVTVTALLDSGADATMLPITVVRNVGARFVRKQRMRGVVGEFVEVSRYRVEVEIGGERLRRILAVGTDAETEFILGRDVLNHLIVTLDGIGSETEIS